MQYCTLQSIEFGHKLITPFDPTKDTKESVCIMNDGKVVYKFLNHYDSIPDAQIAIYGRAYPLPGELYKNPHLEQIPTKLSVEALELTWLDIQGPIDIINQLSLWMIQNDCRPLYHRGGISGPSFINMAFTKYDATKIITKLIEMKAEIV